MPGISRMQGQWLEPAETMGGILLRVGAGLVERVCVSGDCAAASR